jgi:rod shape-determining protein MreB
MIVDCGGGAIDVAVISLGGLCVSETLRRGGIALDRAIIDHLHLNHRFQVGPRSAEQLKLDISKAYETGSNDLAVSVKGSDMASGLPSILSLPASEFRRVWVRFVRDVAATVREALARTSPELARDVLEGGIHLTGNAARTALLGLAISKEVGVAVHSSPEPEFRVARGLASYVTA